MEYALRDDRLGHTWKMLDYDPTRIDIFAYEYGNYHNGPVCGACGFGFCHHCAPEEYTSVCPVARERETLAAQKGNKAMLHVQPICEMHIEVSPLFNSFRVHCANAEAHQFALNKLAPFGNIMNVAGCFLSCNVNPCFRAQDVAKALQKAYGVSCRIKQ